MRLILIILLIFILIIIPVNSNTMNGLFTINERTVYGFAENTVFLTVCDNIGKSQYINISSIFKDDPITKKINYGDLLMNQSYVYDVRGSGNLTIGKYSESNVTRECTYINKTVCTDITHYYNNVNQEMFCDNVLADKTCNILKYVSLRNETIYDYLPLPSVKEKIIIQGLNIEQKSGGVPLPKGGCVNLKYSYSHPLAYGKAPIIDINKYNITVVGNDNSVTTLDPTWYNSSCNYRIQLNKTGSKDLPWAATYFVLNSSVVDWSKVKNESDFYITNSTDQLIPYKMMEFNQTGNTSNIWFNTTPYNDTLMTFYLYYNCSLVDAQDGNKTFDAWDDAEGKVAGNSLTTGGWAFTSGTDGKYNATLVRYGNMGIRFGSTEAEVLPHKHFTSTSFVMEGYLYPTVQDVSAGFGGFILDYTSTYQMLISGFSSTYWQIYNAGYQTSSTLANVAWHKIKIECWNSTFGAAYVDDVRLNQNYSGCPSNFAGLRTYNGEVAYFDNILVYPYYVRSSEVDVFGSQESQTPANTCTYSGSGNWAINASDHCNLTTSNLLTNNITISGSNINECCTTGLMNLTNYTFLRMEYVFCVG